MNSLTDHLRPPSDPVPPLKPRQSSPLDYHNSDLVSRLLAATPPYLYNMPLVPHSFFFSEMLRSFVQAKNEQVQPRAAPRRSRKRPWREPSYERVKPPIMDKPLELTTSKVHQDDCKRGATSPVLPPAPPLLMPPCGFPPLTASDDMLLPPPPPIWYPPLYPLAPQPPFGVDPLHFFIDLRVSGQIWDRKLGRDVPADLTISEDEKPPSPSSTVKQSKHCSAFSVPHSRSTSDNQDEVVKASRQTGTHYIFQNLPRIYEDVERSGRDREVEEVEEGGEGKCKSDLRAVIGLELVVDYVKQEVEPTPETSVATEEDDVTVVEVAPVEAFKEDVNEYICEKLD